MSFDYSGRISRVRAVMEEQGVDALLLSVGADLPYFCGYEAMPLERLTMLVISAADLPVLVVPALEAPRVVARPGVFRVHPWNETEDPLAMVEEMLRGAGSAALGDETWAVFALQLQQRLPGLRLVAASLLTRELRMRKDPAEVDLLREAAHATDRVVERLRTHRFAGRREIDLSHEIAAMTVEEGHQTAMFAIVASGENGASPHHEPGDRVVGSGDAVVVDFGGRMNAYCSDTTRTFHVGEPSEEYRRAYGVLRRAQAAAVEAVRPGVTAESVDRAAREVIEEAGLGDHFIHRTGHGIGLQTHEHPYLVEGNGLLLEPGMTFSVEPGVYLPGRFGMRIEDIVAVTTDGAERLNRSDRDLAVVE